MPKKRLVRKPWKRRTIAFAADGTQVQSSVFSKAFVLSAKRRRPFGEKHAAFYPKAGVLLKFAARAFFKSRRAFHLALPKSLFSASLT